MAAKNFEEWGPYLNDVLAYWDANGLPATGTIFIGGKEVSRADVVAMRDAYTPLDEQIKAAERMLESLQDARIAQTKVINPFGVDFLAAMKGRFGATSQAARNCPVVSKRRSSGGKASGTEGKAA